MKVSARARAAAADAVAAALRRASSLAGRVAGHRSHRGRCGPACFPAPRPPNAPHPEGLGGTDPE